MEKLTMANTTYIENLTDICAAKHGGNEQSRAANRKNLYVRSDQRLTVYHLIRDSVDGLTMKEVADIMGVALHQVSGRSSELKAGGLIYRTGEIRNGSAV